MKHLPQNFLAVNHEGVFRVYMSFEEVSGLEQLLARHAQHRLLVVKNVASNPFGIVHLGVHTRDSLPIYILEARQGTMGLVTHYAARRRAETNETWISPRFFSNERTFETRAEFDFSVWTQAGFKMFFAINLFEHLLHLWTWFEGQNYRVPFGNVYEDGRICSGETEETVEGIMTLNNGGSWSDNLTKLVKHVSESHWNGDAIHTPTVNAITQLVRFDAKNMQMLPPHDATEIIKMGIMGNPTLAEITKQIV
jgi:hypothetical protein